MPKYTRSNPTVWPNGAYYFLRLFQFLSSLGIVGTLSYFIYYLLKAKLKIPYEFLILYAAGILSLFNITTTTVAKCCNALNAKFAFAIDFLILAAFAVAFGLLNHAMGGLVFEDCTAGRWGAVGGNGVFVCRLYKATWAFAFVATAMYLLSLVLDIVVIRRQGNHKYAPANPKSMQQTKSYAMTGPAAAGPVNYGQDTSYGSGGLPSH